MSAIPDYVWQLLEGLAGGTIGTLLVLAGYRLAQRGAIEAFHIGDRDDRAFVILHPTWVQRLIGKKARCGFVHRASAGGGREWWFYDTTTRAVSGRVCDALELFGLAGGLEYVQALQAAGKLGGQAAVRELARPGAAAISARLQELLLLPRNGS